MYYSNMFFLKLVSFYEIKQK